MAASTKTIQPPPPREAPIPPLEPGDRLSRDEFERRYDAMPELKKAELINGVVHMPSPVRFGRHAEQNAAVIGWLSVYGIHTPGIRVGDNSSIRIDMHNEPQPDALMLIDPTLGGQSVIDEEGYLAASPEYVCEISTSSVSIDLNAKFDLYLRSGVREYMVWRVLDRQIDWFVLRGSKYDRLPANAAGVYESEVFPGLWLDAAAMLRGDTAAVHQVLQQGLASPEHAAFVERLKRGGSQGQ